MPILKSSSEQQTKKIAKKMAKKLKTPAFVCLYGDLGSGKTVFAKGFAEGLGIPAKQIKSPTFTFVRSYKMGRRHFYHFDFYRIESIDDLLANDLHEIFHQKNAYFVIEWAERIEPLLPRKKIKVRFEYIAPSIRKLSFP